MSLFADTKRRLQQLRIDPPHRRAVRMVKTAFQTGILRGATGRNSIPLLRIALRQGLSIRSLHAIHGAMDPNRTALVDESRSLTYVDADREINRIAHGLHETFGVGPGSRVAIMSHNRVEYVLTWFALFRLGAAAVHISPHARAGEVADLLARSKPRAVLVSDPSSVVELAAKGSRVDFSIVHYDQTEGNDIGYEELLRSGGPQPVSWLPPHAASDNVVYTSGTTGKPKGALRNFGSFGVLELSRILERLPLKEGDRHLIVSPLHHSGAQAFCLLNTALGGTIYLHDRFEPRRALEALSRERIHSVFMVPTMIARVLELPPPIHTATPTPDLRVLISGAAPFPHSLRCAAATRFGAEPLHDFYGATELGWVTLVSGPEMLARPGTLGRPISGQEVAILDEDGHPVSAGQTGVVYALSAQTMTGYLDDGPGTDEARRGDWLTCDDLGHLDDEAHLFLSGRARDMVISGGVNLYPAEIEDTLLQHPAVRDVAVIGVPDEKWGERLVAVVVVRHPIDSEEIVAWGKERLSPYKVPREWHTTNELPRTPTGKILKRELRRRFADAPVNAT